MKLKLNMVSISSETKNKLLIVILVFFISFVLRVLFLNQMGRTWDENEYVSEGYHEVELLKKGDFNNMYFFYHYDKPPLGKIIFGTSGYLDIKSITNNEPVFDYDLTYSRMVSVFFASLSAVVVVLIAYELISPFVAISSGIIFALLPFFVGLSQLVALESMTMFFFTSATYAFLKFLKNNSFAFATLAGIFAGLAIEVKQSNVLVLIFFPAAYLLWYFADKKQNIPIINSQLKLTLWVLFVSVFTFFIIFPFAVLHIDVIREMDRQWRSSKYSIPEVFFGQLHLTPVFYYVIMFLITTPIFILILFAFGFFKYFFSKKWLYLTILLWFLVPFIQSFYLFRQHGVRYIIEIYAPLAIISASGIELVTEKFKIFRNRQYFLLIGITFYLVIVLWRIHPYYLNYFNELVGGTNTVYKYRLFQIGWWGDGMREAGIFRDKNIPKGSKIGLAISPSVTYPFNSNYKETLYDETKNYDFVMVNFYHIIRDRFDDSEIRKKYNLIHQVKADNATLVFIYKKK